MVVLILVYASSLLVYRNAVEFCVLILYPVTLVDMLISSSNHFVDSLGCFSYKIMIFENRDNFIYSFPFQYVYLLCLLLDLLKWLELPVLCLIAVMRADIIVLFLILEVESIQSFTLKHEVSCKSLVNVLSYIDIISIATFLRVFKIINKNASFIHFFLTIKCFFWISW